MEEIGKIKRSTLEEIGTSVRRNLEGSEEANEQFKVQQISIKIDTVASHNRQRGAREEAVKILPQKGTLEQRVFGEVRDAELSESVNQAVNDFEDIRIEINAKGVSLSESEPTERYAEKVPEVYLKGESAGYESGKVAGAAEGFENGKNAGLEEGYKNGYSTGKIEGYDSGYAIGKIEGDAEGYNRGYSDRKAENNQLARDFSIVVYGEQKNETIENVVNTAITDIGDAKVAIESRGVPVPSDMPTSELHTKIMAVYDSGADIGFSAGKAQGRNEYAEELIEYNHNLQQAVYGIPSGRDIKEVTEQAASDLNAIKEKIKEKGVEIPSLTPSSEYPAKIEDVYDKGYEQGKSESDYEAAFEEGKKAQEREWWDNYLDNGNRTDFDEAISGKGWTIETFKPNHDMLPTTAYMMFRKSDMKIDLVEYLKKLDVKLDFSNCTNHLYIFHYSSFTRVGVVDFSNSTASVACDNTFGYNRELVTIDKIILRKGTKDMFSSYSFSNCANLENVIFDGELESNGLNLQWSTKLSKASWQNIIGCYAVDLTLSMTGSLASVNKAFETSEGANDGSTSAEWLNLLATRPNLTVNLI